MHLLLALIIIVLFGAVLLFLHLIYSRYLVQESRMFKRLEENESKLIKILLVPITAWLLLYLILFVILMVVSAMSLMYAFALYQGEWFDQLQSLPKTAGNIGVHLIYPLQIILLGLLTFYTAIGGLQIVLGPLEFFSRVRLKVADFSDFARRMAALIVIIAGLEALKIILYSLLVAPEQLAAFFARDALPKADPLTTALLAAGMLTALAAWWRWGDKNK